MEMSYAIISIIQPKDKADFQAIGWPLPLGNSSALCGLLASFCGRFPPFPRCPSGILSSACHTEYWFSGAGPTLRTYDDLRHGPMFDLVFLGVTSPGQDGSMLTSIIS